MTLGLFVRALTPRQQKRMHDEMERHRQAVMAAALRSADDGRRT